MTEGLKSRLAGLRDPRLAPHAASALPAWLWRADGSAILWANAAGAAIFGATRAASIEDRAFDPEALPASQIARLGASLRHDGVARLERLRGFGAGMGRPLLCTCARIPERAAILVVAAEPAGPALSTSERVRRLFEGAVEPFAVFGDDGSLLFASPSLSAISGARATSDELGIGALLAVARQSGRAEGTAAAGPVAIERLGSGPDAIFVVMLEERAPGASGPSVDAPAAAREPLPPPLPTPGIVQANLTEAAASESATRGDPARMPEGADRRYPLRFIWEMDADSRFSLTGNEFTDVIGPQVAAALGRPWNEIAAQLRLDPSGGVAAAIASRNTWSGLTVQWPVEGSDRRLPVELSGLPIYDRDRAFRGYRGFGVCRDVALVDDILAQRIARDRSAPAPQIEMPDAPLARPVFTVVPSAENVVPFPGQSSENRGAALTPVERNAFSELASRLTERLKGADELATSGRKPDTHADPLAEIPAPDLPAPAHETSAPAFAPREDKSRPLDRTSLEIDRPMLDRLPVGILVYRHDQFIYANPAFLEWAGHPTLNDFSEAGGLDTLFVEPPGEAANEKGSGERLRLATPRDGSRPLEARLLTIPWDGGTAMALIFTAIERPPGVETPQGLPPVPALAKAAETTVDLDPVFDLLSDAVILVSPGGTIERSNRTADELFGYELLSLSGRALTDILAPDSARAASADLAMLAGHSAAALSGEREIVGRREKGGLVSLVMRMSRLKSGQICVIFRNLSQWRTSEADLIEAKRKAEDSSAAKSEFIARISHEIRTPLNAIIGFSEVMMRERFGPIANERYRDYLRDIHSSGEHLVELLGDLIDLTRIEAGKFDLNISRVGLNDLVQQTVSMTQPQASRARVVLRLSLAPNLPAVQADPRSVRQILLNLLTNAIKFTGAGGQIIVSTGPSEKGGIALRIRDTGKGMSPKDLAVALEPFRRVGDIDRIEPRGAGLGLPLAKALAEANHAVFSISSAVDSGTLVEIEFPAARMVAE
ncbi:MAG: PAS domain-containing sensor histidine kinase [Pseudorhodoplanes sp.]|nr:PAS domain-containing sensor histidine kinase [Pseudorhodoplanes sp.]